MWEKEKISNSLSVGLVALVFIFLSLQFIFFVAKVIEIRKYNRELAAQTSVSGGETSVAGGGVPASEFGQKRARDAKKRPATSGNREKLTRDGEKYPAATGNREKLTRDNLRVGQTALPGGQSGGSSISDTAIVQQKSNSGAVARAFSLEKLPPRPLRKPKQMVELNSADTTALMTLYGIGGYYARKIVDFRQRLGGSFASPEQLMDIYGIDSARFVGFADRVYVDTSLIIPLDLYHMPLDSMARHPYIGKYAARGIDRYRRTVDSASFTLDALLENSILQSAYVQRLRLYQR